MGLVNNVVFAKLRSKMSQNGRLRYPLLHSVIWIPRLNQIEMLRLVVWAYNKYI